eukprot:TRINITY_DN3298_c0_g1_i1.p1 TRINITY_DN3298_c0_g1~~TRINITY_DN3298_c0_g1_i1.p1  ORF type:complete len:908 (+),score=248.51 TRINITY_DN3298_c0_g1_i1:71-2794(+)
MRPAFAKRCTSHAARAASTTTEPAPKLQLPPEADVVVVGGGSVGASVAYHCQARGMNTVLLERHRWTAGTTWHSAGMLWRLRPSDIDIQLHTYTREKCIALEEETGFQSWTENGGLFVATNKERLMEYERLAETGKYFGIESRVLSPSEVQRVHPLMQIEDVYGGLHSPTDGTIDPTGIVNAYVAGAKKRGAVVMEDTGVVGIETENDARGFKKVRSVTTTCGQTIKTRWVVNACGAWAPALAAMAGAELPLLACKHAFVVTEKLPGMHAKLPNVRDHDLSIYLKAQGDTMGIGGYERNPEFWDEAKPEFAFGLFDLDWETFDQNLQGLLQRCPAIGDAGIKATVCGPESFTPDHKPLVGPHPGVRGMFNACGFNSMGMMLGGGMGREAATWMAEGSPSLDLFAFDCARFHPETVRDAKWVKDRTHESYAKTYAVVFPHDEPLAGRGARQSPLHDALAERGCVHQARHGFERPGWFVPPEAGAPQAPKPYDYYGSYDESGAWRLGARGGDARESIAGHTEHLHHKLIEKECTFEWPASFDEVKVECAAAREGTAVFDQSYFGKFLMSGPDASAAVQYLCGADFDGRAPGAVVYTPLCNARGGVEADLTVTVLPDGRGYYFAAGGNTRTKDFEWISTVLADKGFDAALTDISETKAIISVQGPHSRALLQTLCADAAALEDDALPFSFSRTVTIAGAEMMCLRLTFVGELGFELHAESTDAAAVYEALMAAGAEYEKVHGVPVRNAGYRAIDSLSAEKGYRHWHADLSNADTPLEAAIGFTVLSKLKRTGDDAPDFLGRGALEEQRAAGLKRKLVCLTVDDPSVPLHGMESIWRSGQCVGIVRSTAFGHTLNASIAYGYVDAAPEGKVTKKWLEGGEWAIGDKGTLHRATFHNAAPFDPKNTRVKGQY